LAKGWSTVSSTVSVASATFGSALTEKRERTESPFGSVK
jgi:hypothetical protein